MEYREINVPDDSGISSLHFSPYSESLFCTTTWKGDLNIYSIENLSLTNTFQFPSPLICSCWINENLLAAGSCDGTIYFSNGVVKNIHKEGVSQVGYIQELNYFYSASWDGFVHIWDNIDTETPKYSFEIGQKILVACNNTSNIVLCTNLNKVFILDLTEPGKIETRVSSLQMQIRSISASRPSEYGWAVASIDGRVAIEYFGDLRSQAQRFAFHGHRKETEDDKIIVYPINSMSFHPLEEGILATACSGGNITFWDISRKIKLSSVPFTCETSISAIDFSINGQHMAIASSYMWDKGEIEHPPDRLLIHNIYQLTQQKVRTSNDFG